MTTGIEYLKPEKKKRGRGASKKGALFCTSLRVSIDVKEYFDTHYPNTKQAKMREVLAEYVKNQLEKKND